MHRLVNSSNPEDVDRDKAVNLLTQRAILTRAVCRELLDADTSFNDRRPQTSLVLLLQWIARNLPESVRFEPHPSDGIDSMVVPDTCRELLQEIRDGAEVCEALFMLLTADNRIQADNDQAIIQNKLDRYWANHRSVASLLRK
jgi:hypothetical protein